MEWTAYLFSFLEQKTDYFETSLNSGTTGYTQTIFHDCSEYREISWVLFIKLKQQSICNNISNFGSRIALHVLTFVCQHFLCSFVKGIDRFFIFHNTHGFYLQMRFCQVYNKQTTSKLLTFIWLQLEWLNNEWMRVMNAVHRRYSAYCQVPSRTSEFVCFAMNNIPDFYPIPFCAVHFRSNTTMSSEQHLLYHRFTMQTVLLRGL